MLREDSLQQEESEASARVEDGIPLEQAFAW